MATSSSTPTASFFLKEKNIHNHEIFNNHRQCSFLRKVNSYKFSSTRISKKYTINLCYLTFIFEAAACKDVVVRRATAEVAGDLASSFSLTTIIGEHPWLAGASGLLVGVPFMIQKLVALTKQIDMAAQAVEKVADTVEKMAEGVDKAAEDLKERLPEGNLKQVVSLVEHLAEETAQEADKVIDLMDKVEAIDEKMEEFLENEFEGHD